jgi:hypothetical protein
MARRSNRPAATVIEQPKPWTAEGLEAYITTHCEDIRDELSESADYSKVEARARKALDEGAGSFDNFLRWQADDVFAAVATMREFHGFWSAVGKKWDANVDPNGEIAATDWLEHVREMIQVRVAEIHESLPSRIRNEVGHQSTSPMHSFADNIELRTVGELIRQYEHTAMKIGFVLETIAEKSAEIDLQAEHDNEPGYKAN